MEYTELADYPLPSGVVTEWLPSVPADAWRTDHRALSTNHVGHLRTSAATPPAERTESWIGTAFRLDPESAAGPQFDVESDSASTGFDRSAFTVAVHAWIARHETFRTTANTATTPDTADGTLPQRTVVDAEDVTVTVRAGDRVLDAAEVYAHIDAFFATEITATHWPHLVFATVEPEDGGVIVVLAADHSVMDAYTQLLAIVELRELYRAAVDDTRSKVTGGIGTPAQLPPCGSYVDYSAAEAAEAAAIVETDPVIDAWRTFLETAPGQLETPAFPLPVSAGAGLPRGVAPAQSSLSLWLLSDAESAAFGAACKQHGGSLSAGTLTALSIAFARLTSSRVTRYVMPMHTRTSPDWYAAAGWFVGLAPVETDLGGADTFSAAIGAIGTAVKSRGHLAAHSYPRIAELLGVTEPPAFVVSFIDCRNLPGAEHWTDRDRALRARTYCGDEVYLWINRTRRGMNVSLRFPNNENATASLHALIAELSTVLRSVAADGDTPVLPGSPGNMDADLSADLSTDVSDSTAVAGDAGELR